jgi:hypothetical protein
MDSPTLISGTQLLQQQQNFTGIEEKDKCNRKINQAIYRCWQHPILGFSHSASNLVF